MDNFIKALERSIETENWYSALFISLTIPDICGKIDEPNESSSKKRTINWFDKYLLKTYTINSRGQDVVFLNGSDFYSLRCSYLHEGRDDISEQRAREVLNKFRFVQPIRNGVVIHKNLVRDTLQLQVDQFANEILNAVKLWNHEAVLHKEKQIYIDKMLDIEMVDMSKGFFL